MTADILHLPSPEERGKKLSPDQEEYWWEQYEIAQRMAEYAMRQLGIITTEKGLEI